MEQKGTNKRGRGNPKGRTREMRLAQAGKNPLCGAQKKGAPKGETCTMPAGYGTDHPGTGSCKWHMGNTKQQAVAAGLPLAEKMLGKALDITPHEALIACVQYAAGDVAWFNGLMHKVDEKDPVVVSIFGSQMDLLFKERQRAIELLARTSKLALDAGVAERQIQLAESVGTMIATALNGILAGLMLTDDQKALVPGLVRMHLADIEGRESPEVLDADATDQLEKPAARKRTRARKPAAPRKPAKSSKK